MRASLSWILALLCSLSAVSITISEQPATPKLPESIVNHELELAAIQAIHEQLDDNEDGSVDVSESSEFVETELCGSSMESQQACWSSDKSKRFHQTDKQITSMELWSTWHKNKVINWSTEDVVTWLTNTVHLPQYSETFRYHKITGRHLPQLAVNTNQILQSLLLVSNSKHKHKIQLRAMDVVLFGPPVGSGYWKDALLTLSIALSVCGVLYALRQRHLAQSRIDSFLEDFRIKEEELSKLKCKLELEKAIDEGEQSISSDSVPTPPSEEDPLSTVFSRSASQEAASPLLSQIQEENQCLRNQLRSSETQFSSKMSKLRVLLQECSRKEWTHLDSKRRAAEDQMSRAQKVCDKIKKKRYSLFGSFHLANSSALEEAGLQITKAVNKMHSISECFDEYHLRWEQIEKVCGYSIVSSTASTPTHHTPLTHMDSILSFTREGSPHSISSVSTINSTQSSRQCQGSPEIVRQRTSSSSIKESSLEYNDNRPHSQYQSADHIYKSESELPTGRFVKNEPSKLIHSTSVPVLRRGCAEETDGRFVEANGGILFVAPNLIERSAAKGLEPIKEEKQGTHASTQKRTMSLSRKSKSSEV